MISSDEKWHYFTVTKLSALLRGVTSKITMNFVA